MKVLYKMKSLPMSVSLDLFRRSTDFNAAFSNRRVGLFVTRGTTVTSSNDAGRN